MINSADPEATRAFYEKHLAFALSDTLMHPRMGEMMWFMRINAWHHSLAIARGPHPSLHHASFELRGIDEYMRGTGRLLRAGVEKIWGPGRHLAGNNTFSYFLDPHGNTIEYTTELELIDEDTWHPHLYDFTEPEVADQWGTANAMNEFVAAEVVQRPRQGSVRRPPGLMRFATWEAGGAGAAPASSATPACTRCPRGTTVLDLVRAGLPAALEAGAAALDGPAVPLDDGPAAAAAGRRRRSATSSRSRSTSRASSQGVDGGAGVVPEWYQAPTFYFTNPYALIGAHDDVAGPAGLAAVRLRARGRRRRRPGRRVADARSRPASTSSATRSSTTGRPATCSAGR